MSPSQVHWAEGALESLCSDLSLSGLQKPRARGNLLEFPQQIREELGWEFWTPDPRQGSPCLPPPPPACFPALASLQQPLLSSNRTGFLECSQQTPCR